MIQPHLPIRLPCYDFTPVINPTFDCSSIGHRLRVLSTPWCDGRCVQDPGTHSPRHSDPRLLATPTSCRRVAAYNPNWDWLWSFALYHYIASSVPTIVARVSPGHKGHDDLTSSPPSSDLSSAVYLESPTFTRW